MRFEHEFTVGASVQRVWEALLDIQRVAPCMPGAEVLEQLGEDAYRVAVKVKLGPMSLLYRGQVEIAARDERVHSATLRAHAREARGQGTASATVQVRLHESPGPQAQVHLQTDLQLSGRAAAMGRGVIGDVSQQLIGEFARNLQAMLAGDGAGASNRPPRPIAPMVRDRSEPASPEPAASKPAAVQATAATQSPPVLPSASPTTTPLADSDASLSAARIASGLISARLRNPRALFGAATALLLTGGVVGYAAGCARRRLRRRSRRSARQGS